MPQIPKAEPRRLEVAPKDFNLENVPPSVTILLRPHISGNNVVNKSLLLAKYNAAVFICNRLREECIEQSVCVSKNSFIPPDDVIRIVCEILGVTVKTLIGKSRIRYVVEARVIAYYIMRNFCGMSLVDTGKQFNRDHSTVVHGMHLYNALYDTSPVFARRADSCINKCQVHHILTTNQSSS